MRRDAFVLPKVISNSGIFVAVALLFFFSALVIHRIVLRFLQAVTPAH